MAWVAPMTAQPCDESGEAESGLCESGTTATHTACVSLCGVQSRTNTRNDKHVVRGTPVRERELQSSLPKVVEVYT